MTWSASWSGRCAGVAAIALLFAPAPARAYFVAAYDSPAAEAVVDPEADIHAGAVLSATGEPLIVFDVLDIVPLETGSVLRFRTGSNVLPHGAIDFHETWRLNLGAAGGNVLWMTTGRYLAFETLRVEEDRLVLGLGKGVEIGVDQALVDYRATVLEGARARLELGAGAGVTVAKEPQTRHRELTTTRQPRQEVSTGGGAGSQRSPGGSGNRGTRPPPSGTRRSR